MRSKFLTKYALSLVVVSLSIAGGGQLDSLFSAKDVLAADSGGSTCTECHQQAVSSYEQSFHSRAMKGSGADCQKCHGSAEKHIANPSVSSIISFQNKAGNASADLNSQCLACHSASEKLGHWKSSSHNRNEVACASCHTIHSEKLVVDQLRVCASCHKSVNTDLVKRSHHPVREGKVQCSDCHDPHGTPAAHGMIKAENINQLCYRCHAEKRGPYTYEHPPVAENCATCHTVHGSRYAKLLTEKIPNLCQDCHDWSRHPGTPYDAKTGLSGRSPSNRFFARSCLNCHGAIHGSTSFENHAFTR